MHNVRAQLTASVQRVHLEVFAEGLSHRLSTGDSAAFEDQDLLARLGQVICRDEAVQAGAENM